MHSCRTQRILVGTCGTVRRPNAHSHELMDQHQSCYPMWFSLPLTTFCIPVAPHTAASMQQSAFSHKLWALPPVSPLSSEACQWHPPDTLWQHPSQDTALILWQQSAPASKDWSWSRSLEWSCGKAVPEHLQPTNKQSYMPNQFRKLLLKPRTQIAIDLHQKPKLRFSTK